jgi:hypothetical protein
MRNERGALHFEVMHSIPGRLRIHLEKPITSTEAFEGVDGVTRCRYNPRIQTFLCQYDPGRISEERVIQSMSAIYAGQVGTELLHVKRSEESGFSMSPSGALALALIGVDGALKLAGSTLTGVSGWLSTGATMAAVVEHAYQELQLRGSFDPEVMSVVYLINSIGKTNSFQASLVAWAATFGRHLIPRAPREQVYLVRGEERRTTLVPVQDRRKGTDFAGAMLRRGTEMLTRAR